MNDPHTRRSGRINHTSNRGERKLKFRPWAAGGLRDDAVRAGTLSASLAFVPAKLELEAFIDLHPDELTGSSLVVATRLVPPPTASSHWNKFIIHGAMLASGVGQMRSSPKIFTNFPND